MDIIGKLLILVWFVFLLYWLISAMKSKRAVHGSFLRGALMRLILFFVILTVANIPGVVEIFTRHNFAYSGPVRFFGLIVAALGIGFAIWARRHLGRNWGMPMTLKSDPELVTSGPYKYVRNPIYSGALLAMLGSSFVLGGATWLVMFIVVGVYFIYSAKVEEKIMLKAFPREYPEYKKRTKMLIPFVF